VTIVATLINAPRQLQQQGLPTLHAEADFDNLSARSPALRRLIELSFVFNFYFGVPHLV
jgi:hypothetical protein